MAVGRFGLREMTERLDAAALTRMATAYLARYAAPTARLRQVLARRITRWHARRDLPIPDDVEHLIDDVVARLTGLGLVDDHAFALGKARSLVRKGLPDRRVRMALHAAGLDPGSVDLESVLEADEAVQARRYAARKRLGPHRIRDRASFRDKDIRSLIRAGFAPRIAMSAVDADTEV